MSENCSGITAPNKYYCKKAELHPTQASVYTGRGRGGIEVALFSLRLVHPETSVIVFRTREQIYPYDSGCSVMVQVKAIHSVP